MFNQDDGIALLEDLGGRDKAQEWIIRVGKCLESRADEMLEMFAKGRYYESLQKFAGTHLSFGAVSALRKADEKLKSDFPRNVRLASFLCYLLSQPYELKLEIGDEKEGVYPVEAQISLPAFLRHRDIVNECLPEFLLSEFNLYVNEYSPDFRGKLYGRVIEWGHPFFHITRHNFELPEDSKCCEFDFCRNGQRLGKWYLKPDTSKEGKFNLSADNCS